MDSTETDFNNFINGYIDNVECNFNHRIQSFRPDIYNKHIHECIGGILARQSTLAIELANSPATWNGHSAPLFLRCMVDAHITLAWVLEDIETRTKQFIHYGLGQEKLTIEFLEESLSEQASDHQKRNMSRFIELKRNWLNEQLAEWATEVNVGSWSGLTTREMAKETGLESLYKHAYVPWSGAAHNMWQHIGLYNVIQCENPLHKWHKIPAITDMPLDPDYLYRASKYLTLSLEAFDAKLSITCDISSPLSYFVDHPYFNDNNTAS